jgi:hypothetical protein
VPLAPEEIEAVEQARGAGPFTIRPRVGAVGDGKAEIPEIDVETDALLSSGLPGRRAPSERELARENRRRKRHGLPPVVETVTPSATGWGHPVTPSPESADSLAAQFIKQRRADASSTTLDDTGGNGDGDVHEL